MQTCSHAEERPVFVSEDERRQRQLTPENFRLAALLLHTRGYVILKNGIPPEIAEAARDAFQDVLADCFESRDGDGWYQVSKRNQAVFWQRNYRWRIFPKLREPFGQSWIVANPLATSLIHRFLGEGYYCKFVSSDTCLKGALIQSPHRELRPGLTWDPCGLVVNVPLGHCGLDNGPLEVWYGGSHLWSQEVLKSLDYDDDVQDDRNPQAEELARLFPSRRVVLDLGDVLIRDPALMHRGTVNHTDEPRSMLTLCYFRQGEDYDYGRAEYNLDRELWETLEPEVKTLFVREFAALDQPA